MADLLSALRDTQRRNVAALEEFWQEIQDSGLDEDVKDRASRCVENALDELGDWPMMMC